MNVAHVEASQVVPPLEKPLGKEEVCRESQFKNLDKRKNERISKILEQLDLTGIESWTEQQQCLVKKLLEEYQYLFALNLKELGRTSLVQHEIKLSALTHVMRICGDFDVTNLLQYCNENTLSHIARFRSEIQETLCKSREVVTVFLQNQRGDCFYYYIM